ncbi:hypothetical protein, partial [Nitrospirillum bahiense]|uniref:hypothetical protein n=1 Tax=Nitrospirillum amazonense TaxID=28077 RepID=UPI001B3C0681
RSPHAALGSVPRPTVNHAETQAATGFFNSLLVPRLLHEEVTAAFNRPAYKGAPISLREYLKTAPFEERMRKGLEVMRSLGLVK